MYTAQDAWYMMLQVDRRKLKAIALQAMHNHAQAMRAMRVAGMLQIQQRPVPVLMAIAAWSDQHHELWKILAWSAWRGYCMRRIRFKTLCGIIACRCSSSHCTGARKVCWKHPLKAHVIPARRVVPLASFWCPDSSAAQCNSANSR